MPPDTIDLRGHSLLAIFAHPDDESLACGGLLAWCAAGGARVSLLCATRGELGPGSADPLLARTRAEELDAAARVLGIDSVELLSYPDGGLPWLGPRTADLDADILRSIRTLRPDVVVTFDQDGLYWHPDHLAIHERTTAVIAALDAAAPALYYVTLPRGAMRDLVEAAARAEPDDPARRTLFGLDDPEAFGVQAPTPSLVIDTGEYAGRKIAALRCHRSQVTDGAFSVVAEADAARCLRVEQLRRAPFGPAGEPFIERLAVRSPS